MTRVPEPNPDLVPPLTAAQVAAQFGVREKTVLKWVRAGKLHVRGGKFSAAEVRKLRSAK